MGTPDWLLPVAGSLCFIYAVAVFVMRMPSRSSAVGTATLILVIAAWNALAVSAWSLVSAMLIIVWMFYIAKSDEFRKLGISSGKPLPKYAKWIFISIAVEVVVGIGHSYYKYMR